MLVPSYYATVEKIGKKDAALWLTKQIKSKEQFYGFGFEARCRAFMRTIDEQELGNV